MHTALNAVLRVSINAVFWLASALECELTFRSFKFAGSRGRGGPPDRDGRRLMLFVHLYLRPDYWGGASPVVGHSVRSRFMFSEAHSVRCMRRIWVREFALTRRWCAFSLIRLEAFFDVGNHLLALLYF